MSKTINKDPRSKAKSVANAPSKAEAVAFLRDIAQKAHLEVSDPIERGKDLRLIADCIQGLLRWRKGGDLSFHKMQLIHQAARWIDRRPAHLSVKAATSIQVEQLAPRFEAYTESARRLLRSKITEARRRQREIEVEKATKPRPRPPLT
jgi:hypothetical protein